MIKNVLWYFFVLISLLACRTDITDRFDEKNESQRKKYFIKKNEIVNPEILTKLTSIQNKSINLLKKSSENGENDVLEGRIILDNRILVVEDKNQNKSYTFPVRNITDSTSALENLVIVPDKNSYRAFIIRYNVNKNERERIVSGQPVANIGSKTELIDVDLNEINFPTNPQNRGGETTTTSYEFGCVRLIVTTFEAYTCEYCEDWTTWEIDTSRCYQSSGGSGGGGGGTNYSGGNTAPGGGSAGGGTNPIEEEDDPSFAEEYENTVSNFRSQLNEVQYWWFVNPENKYIGIDLANIFNLNNTPLALNFLTSLIDNVTDEPSNIIFLYQAENFLTVRGFNNNTIEIVNNLKTKINNNAIDYDFSNWAFSFLNENFNINWLTFERVFLTPKVTEDGGEIFDIATYSTIQVQKFTLPTFSSVNQNFPRDPNNPVYGMPSSQVYQLVGGNMYTQNINGNPNYQNACAIRVSRALNYAGQSVPVFFNDSRQQKSEKGSDNKNYILTAEAMLAYMLKAYPSPTYSYTGNDLISVYNEIKGKNGIYIIIPNIRSELGASGHADIFYTNDCLVGGCHLGLPSGGSVYFWELK